ncbi:MAG: hypothetical protein JST82_13840 [Bacteroidetes bacterium]|nr:hypothetical protein [Bacteroidota bacterium]
MSTKNYPAFPHHASELSAFKLTLDIYIISLKNGNMVHFVPDDSDSFRRWLNQHHIRDIDNNDGIPENIERVIYKKRNFLVRIIHSIKNRKMTH